MTRVGINVDRNWETELFDSESEAIMEDLMCVCVCFNLCLNLRELLFVYSLFIVCDGGDGINSGSNSSSSI